MPLLRRLVLSLSVGMAALTTTAAVQVSTPPAATQKCRLEVVMYGMGLVEARCDGCEWVFPPCTLVARSGPNLSTYYECYAEPPCEVAENDDENFDCGSGTLWESESGTTVACVPVTCIQVLGGEMCRGPWDAPGYTYGTWATACICR